MIPVDPASSGSFPEELFVSYFSSRYRDRLGCNEDVRSKTESVSRVSVDDPNDALVGRLPAQSHGFARSHLPLGLFRDFRVRVATALDSRLMLQVQAQLGDHNEGLRPLHYVGSAHTKGTEGS